MPGRGRVVESATTERFVRRFNSLPPEDRSRAICTMQAIEWAIEEERGGTDGSALRALRRWLPWRRS